MGKASTYLVCGSKISSDQGNTKQFKSEIFSFLLHKMTYFEPHRFEKLFPLIQLEFDKKMNFS